MNAIEAPSACPPAAPKVSWLLCTHKLDAKLPLALESCLNQTFQDFEVVVVANGPSHQEIRETLARQYAYEERIRIIETEIFHLNFSLNLGLHLAYGKYIARMDADDISYPERLERQVSHLDRNSEITVLGSAYAQIDGAGKAIRKVLPPTEDAEIRRSMFVRNPICHPSVMFRRKEIIRAGGYWGGLHAEDYDLWSRLALEPDVCFANLQEVCLGYRINPEGPARRSRHAYASMASAQFRNFLSGGGLCWGPAALLSAAKMLLRSGN